MGRSRHRLMAFAVTAVITAGIMTTPFGVFAADLLNVLYTFPSVGAFSSAPLIQAIDGNFYGTTQGGGTSNLGTAFRMTPSGAVTILHSFKGGGRDGASPHAALLQAIDGSFYGTTQRGGSGLFGSGTIFRMTLDGDVTILHAFSQTDGSTPFAPLIQTSDGSFYGATAAGGLSKYGTLFTISPAGGVFVLHSFAGGDDGAYPSAALLWAPDKHFYGTTMQGGAANLGTIYRMSPDGEVTILHAFAGGADGSHPFSALIRTSDGNFYGTTQDGGPANLGTVFRMTPEGSVTIVHAFNGGSDGALPTSALTQASNGDLYGATREGGPSNLGTIFKMTPSGTVTILQTFTDADGAHPSAALIRGTDGMLYGSTSHDGRSGKSGVIFRLNVLPNPLAPR